jgi:hypothetical protein
MVMRRACRSARACNPVQVCTFVIVTHDLEVGVMPMRDGALPVRQEFVPDGPDIRQSYLP